MIDLQETSQASLADTQRPITEIVYDSDSSAKALTARTPEIIEQETGISREIMFPEEQNILYVGDPWQRMGQEIDTHHMTIMDYEYGDTVLFVRDKVRFKWKMENYIVQNVRDTYEYLVEKKDDLEEEQKQWIDELGALVQKAEHTLETIDDIASYPQSAEVWKQLRDSLEQAHKQEVQQSKDPGDPMYSSETGNIRRELWYKVVDGERGFRDIYDWKNIIEPKLQAKEQELKSAGMPEDKLENELKEWTRMWINQIRLKKKPEQANVVVGVFPELPFANASFDRFVASWSISAHAFEHFTYEDFLTCWQEILRVLRDDGEAYIFPLDYREIDMRALEDSLSDLSAEDGYDLEWLIYDGNGEVIGPEDYEDYGYTLKITKKPLSE